MDDPTRKALERIYANQEAKERTQALQLYGLSDEAEQVLGEAGIITNPSIQEKRYSCADCGRPLHFHEQRGPECYPVCKRCFDVLYNDDWMRD